MRHFIKKRLVLKARKGLKSRPKDRKFSCSFRGENNDDALSPVPRSVHAACWPPACVPRRYRSLSLVLLCLAACPRESTSRRGKSDGTPGLHCRDSQDASLLPVSLFCCFKRTRFSEERSLHAIHAAKKFVRIRRDGTTRGVHGKRTGNWGFNFKTWIFTACHKMRKIDKIF